MFIGERDDALFPTLKGSQKGGMRAAGAPTFVNRKWDGAKAKRQYKLLSTSPDALRSTIGWASMGVYRVARHFRRWTPNINTRQGKRYTFVEAALERPGPRTSKWGHQEG